MPRFDKLLVLDIDETLVYSTREPLDRPFDFAVGTYFTYRRPGVEVFLRRCFEWFSTGFWTSATDEYARIVLLSLGVDVAEAAFLWARDRCTIRFDSETRCDYFVKDVKKLKRKGYRPEKIIMIDDDPRAVERNRGNAVIVRPYRGDENDIELPRVLEYLETLGRADNVRRVSTSDWKRQVPD